MNRKQKQHKTTVPGHFSAVKVVDNDLAYALRSFKRRVKQTNVLETIKENRTFTKPSVKRRSQVSRAKYIQHIRDLEQQQ
jgi:small subunit ribosomal protein S21